MGLHMIATYTNAGGYTDHYVTLEGDAGTYPLLIGDPDISYTPAYKNAVKIAVHTGLHFYNDVSGEFIAEPVVEEETDLYPVDVKNDVVPIEPSCLVTDESNIFGSSIYDLPLSRLTLIGFLAYIVLLIIDILFPFYLFNAITTLEPELSGFLRVLSIFPFVPAILILPYYLAARLYTRVRVSINEEKIVVEKKFLFRTKIREVLAQDIRRVYLQYDSFREGRYRNHLLYRRKKTPSVIIFTTANDTIKFGAGLDYGELKFIKQEIKEMIGKYRSKN